MSRKKGTCQVWFSSSRSVIICLDNSLAKEKSKKKTTQHNKQTKSSRDDRDETRRGHNNIRKYDASRGFLYIFSFQSDFQHHYDLDVDVDETNFVIVIVIIDVINRPSPTVRFPFVLFNPIYKNASVIR